jgi:hypothetical protein
VASRSIQFRSVALALLYATPPTDNPDSLRFRSDQFGATYAGLELKQEAATQRVRSLQPAAATAFRVMSAAMEALIAEVYKRPVLWDHRNKEYHNRQCVDTAWSSVASKLGIGSKYDGWTVHVSAICALLTVVRMFETSTVPPSPIHSVMNAVHFNTRVYKY